MKEATFFEKCKGLALVFASFSLILFAVAGIIYSASPAKAAVPNTGYESGKYMMSLQSDWDGGKMNWYILAWDTETGRSKMYYGSTEKGSIVAASSAYNLPSSPL